nr:MAG TPA: hypothetical protein [Caudoviricetes sp.]
MLTSSINQSLKRFLKRYKSRIADLYFLYSTINQLRS